MMTPGIEDDILPAVRLIGHGGRLSARGQDVGPDGLAGLEVDSADQIVGRGGNEDQPARGDDRAAIVRRADGYRQHRRDAERSVGARGAQRAVPDRLAGRDVDGADAAIRSEERTSELQSLMRISYAVSCL